MTSLAAVFAAIIFSAGCVTPKPAFEGKVVEIDVHVKGLVCAYCASGLATTFERESKVVKATVNLDSAQLKVFLREGETLTDNRIKELVRDAGYEVDGTILHL